MDRDLTIRDAQRPGNAWDRAIGGLERDRVARV